MVEMRDDVDGGVAAEIHDGAKKTKSSAHLFA